MSPPQTVSVEIGHTFTINCTALGVPTPKIVWRLNWGHVPEKCTMKSIPECPQENDNHAYGEITCPDAKESDQGAYSCEAINIKGSCFAGSSGCGQPGQDAVVVVNKPEGICQQGTFNDIGMHYHQRPSEFFFFFALKLILDVFKICKI